MGESLKRILWFDDDVWNTDACREALEKIGFSVKFETSVDRAMKEIEHSPFAYDLLIWDLSAAPGETFATMPTNGGTRTGEYLHERFRKQHPRVPSLLFTNFKAEVPNWTRPDRKEFAFQKRRFLPDEFASAVRGLLY